ncbi:hypothetical protein LOTGIDRAFT_112564 [Lottia gigantea]|uniref:Phospholipid/glycerol acyltransferase domain-containing protein n=1 Tax=Lottia gigantea TaxID=225164 RepID=V4CFC9_LOTGI|nr:hypothetical protein LOTGIDRAFT_112564 [Lottia gigantea]ESP00725.1 hypothetical protein LOTGIDRAFT_112564 [Lottia gigantea]
MVLAKDIQTIRPFMGLCCSCLPISKQTATVDIFNQNGLHNIFDLKPFLRDSGWIQRRFPILTRTFQMNHQHHYPDVSIAVFTNNRVLEAIQKTSVITYSRNAGKDTRAIQESIIKGAKKTLIKMKASTGAWILRLTFWFLHSVLSLFLKKLIVHRGQILMLQEAASKKIPVIYLPLHRSHLDYILISFLVYNYNVRIPYVAAGDNLDIAFFNKLLRKFGGFFIRRRLDKVPGEKDIIYRTLLHTYVEELLKQGEALEFFVEGGRSRSGKSTLPKGGLLSVVAETCVKGHIPDAYIVPVSISYDKLIDGNFCREQMGLPKVSESFFRAVKAIINVFISDYGSVRMDFAQPFSLKEFLDVHKRSDGDSTCIDVTPDSPPNMTSSYPNLTSAICASPDLDRGIVENLGKHIVHTATQCTALMSTHLVCFLLLTKYRNGANINELSLSMKILVKEIREHGRDIGFSGDMSDAIHNAVGLLGSKLTSVEMDSKNQNILMVKPNLNLPHVFELAYYGNNVISVFLMESIVAIAIVYVSKNPKTKSSGEIEVTKEEIIETAAEICNILSQEFIFIPPCKNLMEELSDILEKLMISEILYQDTGFGEMLNESDRNWSRNLSAAVSWADEDDEEYDFGYEAPVPQKFKLNLTREDIQQKMKFLLSVLASCCESYLTTAKYIDVSLKTELAEDDFIKHLNHFAKSQARGSKLEYNESCALDSLKVCVKSFSKLGILESYTAGNLRILGLQSDFDTKDKLFHYIKLLEAVTVKL